MKDNERYLSGQQKQANRDFEGAIKAYSKAITNDLNNPDIYSDRAVCYFHLKQSDKSLADMNKAVELQPDHGYRYSSRAFIKESMGNTEGAIEDYKKAIEIDPEDAISHNNLGMLEEKLGWKEQANDSFDKADKLADKLGLAESMGVTIEEKGKGMTDIPKPESAKELKPKNIQKEIDKQNKLTSLQVIIHVFKSKNGVSEFLRFIANGFKIKE